MKRRIVSLLLMLAIACSLFSGCTQSAPVEQPAPDTATPAPAETTAEPSAPEEEDAAATITIVDHTGNEVTIPANINRVVIDQVPLYATYVMYMGGTADKLVGIAASNKKTLESSLLMKIAPEIADVSTKHNEDGELNVEELLNLEPDVVLYNAGNTEHGELFKQAGIPAVGFSTNGDPTEIYAMWLRLLEQVFQEPGKMDDVVNYGTELINSVKERTASIADEDKKNVLILFNYGNGTPRVSGSQQHFGTHWLRNAGVINAAEEVVGVAEANMEQIYTWDPDLIIMPGPGQCSITPQQVLENTVEGADFSPLTAVKNGEVYSNSLGMWSWYIPSSDAPLVLQWIAKLSYPDLFADVDMRALVQEYYHNFYNYDLNEAEIDFIFDRSTTVQ